MNKKIIKNITIAKKSLIKAFTNLNAKNKCFTPTATTSET